MHLVYRGKLSELFFCVRSQKEIFPCPIFLVSTDSMLVPRISKFHALPEYTNNTALSTLAALRMIGNLMDGLPPKEWRQYGLPLWYQRKNGIGVKNKVKKLQGVINAGAR